MRTGQAEFIILVGVVILVVIVLLFAFRPDLPSPLSSGIGQEQKSVRETITQTVTSAGTDTLRTVFAHGGYLSASDGTQFLGSTVPYWQQCESSNPPTLATIEQEIERGMTTALRTRVPNLGLRNTDIDLSKLSVDVHIQDHTVRADVVLPTTVSGYAISQPYSVNIPSELKEIISFGRDFSDEAASSRLFEYHMLASMYFSPLAKDGEPEVPTFGFLQNCGQTLYRSTSQLSDGMTHILQYMLASTLWWVPRPVTATGVQVFSIPTVSGKTYPDLDIAFYVPDQFAFRFLSPVAIQNREFIYTLGGPFSISNCQQPYFQKYNVIFPVVTSVRDPLSGNQFSFASLASIADEGDEKSMIPSTCGGVPAAAPSTSCDTLLCRASIRVISDRGASLSDVQGFANGCYIGESDQYGIIKGNIPCGTFNVSLYASEIYDYEFSETNSDDLADATYVLSEKIPVTIFFKEFIGDSCSTRLVDHESISVLFTSLNGHVFSFTNTEDIVTPNCDTNNPSTCSPTGAIINTNASGEMPSGTYSIQMFVTNPTVQGANPDRELVPFVLSDNIVIPTRDLATITFYLLDTDPLFSDAAVCVGPDGGGSIGQCAPTFASCSGLSCGNPASKEQRLLYTLNYFYSGGGRADIDSRLGICGKPFKEVS